MDLLSDYRPLAQNKVAAKVEEQRTQAINLLNVTYIQVVKIKRLLSSRLSSLNLTFLETFENPEFEAEQADKQKQGLQPTASKKKIDIQNYLNFSLITKSHLPDYEILINFSINVKRATISFQSKILKNHRLIKIQSRSLVRFMAKYFVSYNSKIKEGSFFVNPITTEFSLFIHNHLSFDSISDLIRNPQKFLVFTTFYVDQISSKWSECLDPVLYLINKKTYDEINPSKKFKYAKEKLKKLGQMIIHSHIDASFFVQNKGIPRFQKISDDERNHKSTSLKNELTCMLRRAKGLDVIKPIIKLYIGAKKISQAQFKFTQWQATQVKQMSDNLACSEYCVGRSTIYSEIEILNVFNEACVFESGFSKIYQMEAEIKREQENPTKALLIKKKTQDKRYKNEVSILKLIQKQRFLFLPRYYFCQQEEHKQSIFIQFIPDSSLDRYLMTKSIFIGNETKLFFLFMVIIALRFLRDNSIVHIDLKPENLLMKIVGDGKQSVHYLIKLIDFGESYSPKIDMLSGRFLIDSGNSNRGFTIPYAPPELLSKSKRFDEKTDVYSFGVIMFKLMFNHFPTQIMRLSKTEFVEENYLKFYTIPYEKLQVYGTVEFMQLLYYLCLKCVQPNPIDRPTLDWLCIILKNIILTYDEITK